MKQYLVSHLHVRDFRGITVLDCEVPPEGVIFSGGNALGKTSAISAIKAALTGEGVSSESIRIGADEAEILVDLDGLEVTRKITPTRSSVRIVEAGQKAPAKRLAELLGTSSLDPLAFFLAKPSERQRIVLEAMPVEVDRDWFLRYVPEEDLPVSLDLTGHGLVALGRVRRYFFDLRADANRLAKQAEADAGRARAALVPVTEGPSVAEAQAALTTAQSAQAVLAARAKDVETSAAATAKAREQISALRADAEELRAVTGPSASDVAAAQSRVDKLRAKLAEEEDALAELRAAASDAALALTEAARCEEQAAQLSAAVAATPSAPAPEEIAATERALTEATEALRAAEARGAAKVAQDVARQKDSAAAEAASVAKALDGYVKALTNEAPAALASEAGIIPGLTFDGDKVLLEGVAVDLLSGAEQMVFAVELAKRANPKTKILVCDRMEALDTDQLAAFLAAATEGGYQVFGTRVTQGQMVVQAISEVTGG